MTYEHICINQECNFEWEDDYSIHKEPPTTCPKCNKETAKRLISGGSGKGIVELSGDELIQKIKSDARQLKKDVYNSEKVYSNFLGENKYQGIQSKIDKNRR